MQTTTTPEARIFALPGAVTIENIETVTEDLRKLSLSPGETLQLDVLQTDIITTPGIQLILALAKSLEQSGGALVILKPKESFTQAFHTLGLKSRLTEWEESKWLKKS